MVLLRDVGQMENHFGTFGDSVCLHIVLILAQERHTVCAEGTTGMEIALVTPDGTPT
jgi:hypothetical protein